MKKEKIDKIVNITLESDEKLIGSFWGCRRVSMAWYFIVGPLAFLGFTNYLVTVTDKNVHFHRLGLVNQHVHTDVFSFDKIDGFDVEKSSIGLSSNANFSFKNSNRLKLQVSESSRLAHKNTYLGSDVINHLKNNIQEV